MFSKYDAISYLRKNADNDKMPIGYNEETNCCYDKGNGEEICHIDTFVSHMRKKLHCDFDCIFHEHASLTTVYRCNECGAIIFSGDDERYDPNLVCPNCTDYPHTDFWTKEEIENDEQKQRELNGLLEYARIIQESEERRERRGGLYDWQLARKKFFTKKHSYNFELKVDDITKSKVKGLELEIGIGENENPDKEYGIYTVKHIFTIPLSFNSLKRLRKRKLAS